MRSPLEAALLTTLLIRTAAHPSAERLCERAVPSPREQANSRAGAAFPVSKVNDRLSLSLCPPVPRKTLFEGGFAENAVVL